MRSTQAYRSSHVTRLGRGTIAERGDARRVRVRVAGTSDTEPEEIADLTWQLKEELLELDVEAVEHERTAAPPGAKGDALAWAQLIVTLSGSLPMLVNAARGWLGRQQQGSVTIELDGDVLTLERASPEAQRDLIDAWLRRHPSHE
jgi:hypothetical protein